MKQLIQLKQMLVIAAAVLFCLPANAQFKTVQVHDYGLGMTMFTVAIPQSWSAECGVSINTYSGAYDQWKADFFSQQGEVVRIGRYESYGMMQTQDYVWNMLLGEILAGVSNGQLSQWQPDHAFAQTQSKQPNMQMLVSDFQGYVNGQQVSGKVRVVWVQNSNYAGMYQLRAEWSPNGNSNGNATALKIFASQRANPQWSKTLDQMTKASQQAMAQRGRSGGNGGSHAGGGGGSQRGSTWSDDLQAWGRGENGNTHTSDDQFTDWIREENTVENPNTGMQVGVSWDYEYWYINPLGDKYGTNDPFHTPKQGYERMIGVN